MAILFHQDAASQVIGVAAQAGQRRLQDPDPSSLAQSPVRDLMLWGGEEYLRGLNRQAVQRFRKLLEMIDFEACIGVPVPADGRVEHALFLFDSRADALSRDYLRDAHMTATLIGIALESQTLETRIHRQSPFLLKGQLAAGFGHDVYNKMSALELQVRNLKAGCASVAGCASAPAQASAKERADLVAEVDDLLARTLDLKGTVGVFRELMQAENRAEIDVNVAVRRSIGLMDADLRRQRVHFEAELAAGLPPVAGSPARLQQVFLNLMLNAIQQMEIKKRAWPEGRLRLCVSTGMATDDEGWLWVRFEDNGPGIHRCLWDRIFDLGFSTRPWGTGMGLFIARSLTQSMGGRITVERSLVPARTAFRIDLPAGSQASDEESGS
jgi:signal transduction histidine kinase